MPSASAQHWDLAYGQGERTRSWYQSRAETSLELITAAAPDRRSAILDVGGGASTLVDGLLAAGYQDVTVNDISPVGLEIARRRLGERAEGVHWLLGDVAGLQPGRHFDLWHDRAVLHFMVTPDDQQAYRDTLMGACAVGSVAVIGVFGPGGPQKCSGLDVHRSSQDDLARFLGPQFRVVSSRVENHRTPAGSVQEFLWVTATRTS